MSLKMTFAALGHFSLCDESAGECHMCRANPPKGHLRELGLECLGICEVMCPFRASFAYIHCCFQEELTLRCHNSWKTNGVVDSHPCECFAVFLRNWMATRCHPIEVQGVGYRREFEETWSAEPISYIQAVVTVVTSQGVNNVAVRKIREEFVLAIDPSTVIADEILGQ